MLLLKNSIDTKLKPLVHCPTFMHNMKVRFGRGFSLLEIKKAKIAKNYSNSIAISIDKRRRRKNLLKLSNINRIGEYLSKILLVKKKEIVSTKEIAFTKKKSFVKNSFRKYSIKQSFL